MTVAAGRVVVTVNLHGHSTHWYRYYTVGKMWRSACGLPVSEHEDTHRAIKNPRRLKLTCKGCLEKLIAELAEVSERNSMWERLFHAE